MTLQERLEDAKSAYHDLMTGKNVVEVVDQNGERVRYGVADRSRLAAYIADLERRIRGTSIGPLEFWGR